MRTRIITAAMSIAAVIGVSASLSVQSGYAQETDVTNLQVGYIPAGVYAYFWRARDAGYFRDENIEVELIPMAGGGQVIPALQSGALQFGVSDALGVLNARNGGIPVTFVSFNFSQSSESPVHAVLTMDPEIQAPGDLEGKAIATNLSYNTDWTMMREWLRQNDVDVGSVTFREIPFPDMLAALRSGAVVAAGAIEPFVTLGKEQGARVLGHYFTDVQSPVVLSGIAAMRPWIEENEDLVRRFVRAVNRAIEDFEDTEVARETIAANTQIPESVVQNMELGHWETDVPPERMQFWVDAAQAEGLIEQAADLETLVWTDN